jgi:hypothetical protein
MSEEENQSGMLNQRAVTPIVGPIGAEWWPRDIDNSIQDADVTVIDQPTYWLIWYHHSVQFFFLTFLYFSFLFSFNV